MLANLHCHRPSMHVDETRYPAQHAKRQSFKQALSHCSMSTRPEEIYLGHMSWL
jgi:hypothetical protein